MTDVDDLPVDQQFLYWCANSLPYFAEHCLKVKGIEPGELKPLIYTQPQLKLHFSLEHQLKETGMVRCVVPKSRRVGVSTYVASRFYHKTSMHRGRNTYILSHLQATTDTLFGIVSRFQEHNPIAPVVGRSNIKQLLFSALDSGYEVGTAGSGNAGRGQLAHYLHLSELAYMEHAEQVMASSMQIVSDQPGTEVLIESTGKEPYGSFYNTVQDALKRVGDYICVFIPWHQDPANVRQVPEGFEIDGKGAFPDGMSEKDAMVMFNLTLEQVVWRRAKLFAIKSYERFCLEYPSTITDVWMDADKQGLIPVELVLRARRVKKNPSGAVILGVDCASMGGDRFSIAKRQGQVVPWVKSRRKVSVAEGVAWVKAEIDEHQPDVVNIDAAGGGNGDAIVQALRQDARYAHIVKPVLFGAKSQSKLARPDKPGPMNRRAEMYGRTRDALVADELQLPDQDSVQTDLTSPEIKWVNPSGDWMLEPKHKMAVSPDEGDAVVLTFADNFPHLRIKPLTGEARPDDTAPSPPIYTPRLPPPSCGWMS